MSDLSLKKTRTGVNVWQKIFPTPALAVLLGIGFVDLVATALLHHHGLIVELNPLMKPLIETSEWLFAAVKGLTLALAWCVMLRYADTHLDFIRQASTVGSIAYVVIWTAWFIVGSL